MARFRYGIFILVATWRSADKHQGSRVWSPLAKLTSSLIVLWFGGNLGLYLMVKTLIPPAVEDKIDYVPENLKLPESHIEADLLYLRNFKLKFPFYKEDIQRAYPSFSAHELKNITIFLGNNARKGLILFDEIPDSLPEGKTSIATKITNWLLNNENDTSYFNTIGEVEHSRLKDYSWWNVRNNLKLAVNLTLKAISIPALDDLKVTMLKRPI